ncbi:MAG: hypothetical protein AAFY84_08045 [Pseudomonadota bacterium]
MRAGFLTSVVLHGSAVALAFVSLPEGLRTTVEAEPVIPIELIAEAELDLTTSVPAAAPEPVEEPVEVPDLPEPEPIEPEPVEPEPSPEPEPAPPEPEPEPEPAPPEPEPEPEPEPKKTEPKPEPEKKGLDLNRLSALVDKERENKQTASQSPSQVTEQADTPRAAVGAGDRLTASETAKMQAAIAECWQAGSLVGAPEPERLKVLLEVQLNRDGSLLRAPKVLNGTQIALSGNRFWKVAEQNAVRAVQACAPYGFLSPDRYETWQVMELNFDPSVMAGF